MSLFRVYVDGALFYHPQMSKLAITQAQIQEDAENIDSLTLSAPHNHRSDFRARPTDAILPDVREHIHVVDGENKGHGNTFRSLQSAWFLA